MAKKVAKRAEFFIETFVDEDGAPRWRLKARNNEIVLSSEAYSSDQARDDSINALATFWAAIPCIEVYKARVVRKAKKPIKRPYKTRCQK